MLYKYNPTGHYFAGNILLAPKVVKELRIPERKSTKESMSYTVYDSIEISYFDKKTNKQIKIDLPLSEYEKFYDNISGDENISDVTEDIETLFQSSSKSDLSIYIHPEGAPSDRRLFERVEFTDGGDYYRIQLRDEKRWIYFKHPYIYEDIKRYFL